MPRINDIDWKKIANNIMSQLLACDIPTARVVNTTANALIVEVIATRDEYNKCITPIINDLQGHMKRFRRRGGQSLGAEYEYLILFTSDPEDAKDYEYDPDIPF